MKNGKSTGEDSILPEILTLCVDITVQLLKPSFEIYETMRKYQQNGEDASLLNCQRRAI
jgi:hypothetical protein